MYKEHKFPKNSFIKGWYVSDEVCDFFIKLFNDNKNIAEIGKVGIAEINEDVKTSLDLTISVKSNFHLIEEYKNNLNHFMELYKEEYIDLREYRPFGLREDFNIQYYKPEGGFKVWHSERMNGMWSSRVLVFMTYLNDVPDGGTLFKYQKIKVPAKKGLTLIWPSDFTHTHKGEISKKEKYIVTGWIDFL